MPQEDSIRQQTQPTHRQEVMNEYDTGWISLLPYDKNHCDAKVQRGDDCHTHDAEAGVLISLTRGPRIESMSLTDTDTLWGQSKGGR